MHDTVSLYPIGVSGSANGPIMGQLLDAMEVFDAVDASRENICWPPTGIRIHHRGLFYFVCLPFKIDTVSFLSLIKFSNVLY